MHSAAGAEGFKKHAPPLHVPLPTAAVQVSTLVPHAKGCFTPPLAGQLVVPGVNRIEYMIADCWALRHDDAASDNVTAGDEAHELD